MGFSRAAGFSPGQGKIGDGAQKRYNYLKRNQKRFQLFDAMTLQTGGGTYRGLLPRCPCHSQLPVGKESS